MHSKADDTARVGRSSDSLAGLMACIRDSQRLPTTRDPHHLTEQMASTIANDARGLRADMLRLAVSAGLAIFVIVGGYLALVTPGTWFPRQDQLAWRASQLALIRGTGNLVADELVVTTASADGSVLISIETDFRTDQYPGVAWAAIDVPEGADVRLLWRNDVAPGRVNSVPVTNESGRPRPIMMAQHPAWIGRTKGIALLITTRLDRPLHVRGAIAKPMGMPDLLGDRWREWFAFEPWTGESIDIVTGGADLQDLPLPILVTAIGVVAVALWFAWSSLAVHATVALPVVVVAVFAVGTLVLDARYVFNLARQTADTAARYKGLDWREKHLAAEDGELFEFVEKARAMLPHEPVRIFIAAEAHYFRGRIAYHLYPHNIFYDPIRDTMPRANQLRAGDWLIVYRRRGAQYDAATKRLRWDGGSDTVGADLVLADGGSALFRVQ
jgi:hypothetical protein